MIGFQFVISIILARILGPKDYGLIGMLIVFIAVAAVFVESGFCSSLVQKKDADDLDFNTVFYFNILIGVLAYLLLYIISPFVADFYQIPQMTFLLRILAFKIIISCFHRVQLTILFKELLFRKLALINICAYILSGVVAIVAALSGAGVWSIILQQLMADLVMLFWAWFRAPWYPRLVFSLIRLRGLFGYGSKILATEVFDAVFKNLYSVIIGKCYATVNLGLFSRANSLQQQAMRLFSEPLTKSSIPVLAKIQDDNKTLRKALLKYLKTCAFIGFPVMGGLWALASPFILILLSSKWEGCVEYLQILVLFGAIYPLSLLNISVLKAKQKSGYVLIMEIFKKTLLVIVVLVTTKLGIKWMLYGLVIQTSVSYIFYCFLTRRLINLSVWDQLNIYLPYLLNTFIMVSFSVALSYYIQSNLFKLMVIPPLAIIVYTTGAWIMKQDVFLDILNIIRKHSAFRKYFAHYAQ